MLFIESEEYRNTRDANNVDADRSQIKNVKITPTTKKHIYSYSGGSRSLNDKLISGDELSADDKKIHASVKKVMTPFGRTGVVYSGTNHDFGEMARQSKDGIIHSPAHISASHSLAVASFFASVNSKSGDGKHFLRVRLSPEDKVSPISAITLKKSAGEREVVIPSGTKLQYHKTTTHRTKDKMYHMHHFTIHSQE